MACRTARPKRELLRVVRTPAGAIQLDETGRLAGRGAYLCRDGSCWQTALDKGALTRALGSPPPAAIRAALATKMTNTPNTTNTTMTTMTTGGDERGEE